MSTPNAYDFDLDEMSLALSYVNMNRGESAVAAPAPAQTPAAPANDKPTKEKEETNKEENNKGKEDTERESQSKALSRLKKEAEERLASKEAKQRTLVCIEVKPWDVDQDLMELWKKITTTITQDGLNWGETCTLVPVAFGIKKIQCTFTMGVSNSSDDVVEKIEAMEDEVQSVEITSMNVL